MLKNAIEILSKKKDLSTDEMQLAMEEIMSGKALEPDIESFLIRLKDKGESIDEITGAALAMRKFVKRIKTTQDVILDTCGTGGDNCQTFNISTIAAFLVAAAGIKVAKHGNRSITSSCGSADLLESLGVNLSLEEERIEQALEKIGIAFLFAPQLHPAMKYAMPVRKKLKIRTIFNILGPLTNPAFATHQIMGVFKKDLVEPLAHVLANLGLVHAMVVHGEDGLDEISTTSGTFVCEYKDGKFKTFSIKPEDLDFKRALLSDLKGGDGATNAKIALDILKGSISPKRDIVLLNAAAAIYVADKAKDISDGLKIARETLDSGAALKKLELLREFTNQ
ncbi:MAG: anthranilate phosphoribosyltransferase [Candidatus Omnitrophota bacterium]